MGVRVEINHGTDRTYSTEQYSTVQYSTVLSMVQLGYGGSRAWCRQRQRQRQKQRQS